MLAKEIDFPYLIKINVISALIGKKIPRHQIHVSCFWFNRYHICAFAASACPSPTPSTPVFAIEVRWHCHCSFFVMSDCISKKKGSSKKKILQKLIKIGSKTLQYRFCSQQIAFFSQSVIYKKNFFIGFDQDKRGKCICRQKKVPFIKIMSVYLSQTISHLRVLFKCTPLPNIVETGFQVSK